MLNRTLRALACAIALVLPAATTVQASSVGAAGVWTSTGSGASPVNATLSFPSVFVLSGDGFFNSFDNLAIGDLPLVRFDSEIAGNLTTSFYSIDTSGGFDGAGWKTYSNEGGQTITFDLDLDSTWRRTHDSADGDVNWQNDLNSSGLAEFTGTYTLPGGSTFAGTGSLNASSAGTAFTFQMAQQAAPVIPLPASIWLLAGAGGVLVLVRRRRAKAA